MNRKIITIENGIIYIPASDNIWMTGYELADLLGCFTGKVESNIRAILKSGVLDDQTACRTYRYENGNLAEQYSLEMIIALAFRINTNNADVFRQWIVKKVVTNNTEKQILMIKEWNHYGFSPN